MAKTPLRLSILPSVGLRALCVVVCPDSHPPSRCSWLAQSTATVHAMPPIRQSEPIVTDQVDEGFSVDR